MTQFLSRLPSLSEFEILISQNVITRWGGNERIVLYFRWARLLLLGPLGWGGVEGDFGGVEVDDVRIDAVVVLVGSVDGAEFGG